MLFSNNLMGALLPQNQYTDFSDEVMVEGVGGVGMRWLMRKGS